VGHPKDTGRTGIGMRKHGDKVKAPLASKSERGDWIADLRGPIKEVVMKITFKDGYPPHIPGCHGVMEELWDLDEINGRHTMGPVPAALWPRDMQMLRRCCHMLKTARGHVDYRSESVREALWASSDFLVSLLPPVSGSNPYTKKDLSKALRRWSEVELRK